ncbi:MAG: ABC transporter ATP-binding protein, partial [Acidaminococcaceae bacterium]
DIFKHIESLSFRYFDNSKTGQLLSRIVGDISEIGELSFRGPNDIIVCSVTMLGTMGILLYMNWKIALVICCLLVYKAFDTLTTNRRMKAAFRDNRAKMGDISAQVEDSISGIRLVKAFTNENYELHKFSGASRALLTTRVASYKILAKFSSSVSFFTNLIHVTLLIVGGWMIANGQLAISDFFAFLLYVGIFMKPVFRLTVLTEMYQRGMAGFHRFCEIMDEKPDFADTPEAQAYAKFKGEIELKEVTFSYEQSSKVITNVNLQVQAGEMIAFVGPTGAGKTTICNLIPRFYEIQSGSITIDGIDLKQIQIESLRRNVGIVQQDVFIFSDSVRDNIAYGKVEASQEEIVAAAKAAEAHEFIMKLPQGYATNIGERGVKLSGGQKQRIAIARIFLKNPPILILDEATSSLDNETERKIQRALMKLAENRTTLTIAHRLATIKQADRIVVLTEKGIVEVGRQEELLAKRGVYYALYQAQFTEEE